MNVTRLRYFLAVVDTGHLTKAAALVHVSQPALTKAVRLLEQEVGTPLVRPAGRSIAITAEGKELARRVRPLLRELLELPREIRDHRSELRPIRWGSHETFGTHFAQLVATKADGAAIEHHYLGPEAIADALSDRTIDVGVTYVPVAEPSVDLVEAASIAISVWGRPAFAQVAFDELPFAAPARKVISAAGAPQGLDAWPDERISRRVRHRITHTQTALELSFAGESVAFLADFLVEHANRARPKREQMVRIPSPPGVDDHRQKVWLATRADELPEAFAVIQEVLTGLTA